MSTAQLWLAQREATRAMRVGTLTRRGCANGCAGAKTDAHHVDYAKPHDITWLCRSCRSKQHAEHGPGAHQSTQLN